MTPELGRFAAEVLSAYAVSLVLLVGLVWISWRRAVKVSAALSQVEARVKGRAAPAPMPAEAEDTAQDAVQDTAGEARHG